MKLTLFICISLVASLLHAARMPVSGFDHSSTVPEVSDARPHAHDTHASMQHDSMDGKQAQHSADHHESESYCNETENLCCVTIVLQSESIAPFAHPVREEFHASNASNLQKFRLEALFKPPKFYPAFKG